MTREWLRLKHFAVVPAEPVLLPAVTSTLFPGVSEPSRRLLRVCLMAMLAVLLTFAATRLAPALIAVGALGVPLLFALYLRECDIHRHIPRRLLALSGVLGAVLGVAGMLLTGQYVADTYDISVLAGMAMNKYLRHGLVIPLAAAGLKLVPAVAARIVSRPPRKALDGFAIGAAGALAFGAAATLTRLAPQFAVGMIAHSRSFGGLIVEATISGFTVPIAAAASGATVGVALWFTPDPAAPPADRRRARIGLVVLALAVVVLFVGVALTDVAGLSQLRVLVLHAVLAVAAIVVTRLALQIALLHEARPVGDAAVWNSKPATPLRGLLARWTAANAVCACVLIAVSAMVTAKPHRYQCPPDCGKPPVGVPVTALPRFVAPDGAYSVAYPAPGTAYDVSTGATTGVTARLTVGDGGVLRLFDEPARGRESRTVAMDLLRQKFPDAKISYEIPNAMVGYQPGYGIAADRWPQGSSGKSIRVRILALVAVKNDLALVAAAVGPYHQYGPSFGPGLPSGAGLQVAEDMGKYVNSFRWKGDPQN